MGNLKKSDVTVLVNSCDKYEDAWEPFFRLLRTNWLDCPYPIVLNTEKKSFKYDEIEIQVVNSKDGLQWSERLLNTLKTIKTEYIFLLLEDFFLDKPFDSAMFDEVLESMKKDKSIGVIHITHTNKPHDETDNLLWERNYDIFNIVMTATLYRKDFLIKILRKNESPWEFEKYAGIRAKRMKKKIMQYNEKYPVIYSYNHSLYDGTAISGGKWMKNTKKLFDNYGINVEYNHLGFCDLTEQIKRPIQVSKKSISVPNGFIEKLHFYKKCMRKIPAKIKEWWFHIR